MDHKPNKRITIEFPGDIRLVQNDRDMAGIDFSSITAFGFDTETKPAFQKGVEHKTALLQLATDSVAYLIRLHFVTQFQPVREVLENPEILKVGAAISHDLKQLRKVFLFQPKGFIDLQTVAKQKGLKNLGLKKMTEEVLGAHLSKGPKMTNWERASLTDEQMRYAATDAWIGLELYRKITTPAP